MRCILTAFVFLIGCATAGSDKPASNTRNSEGGAADDESLVLARFGDECRVARPRPTDPADRALPAEQQRAICLRLADHEDATGFRPAFLGYAVLRPGDQVLPDRAVFEGVRYSAEELGWDGVIISLVLIDGHWRPNGVWHLLSGTRVQGKSVDDARRLIGIVEAAGLLVGSGEVVGYPNLKPPRVSLEKPRTVHQILNGDVKGTRCENRATKSNYGADAVVVLRAREARMGTYDDLCVFIRDEEIVYVLDLFGEF